MSTRRDERAGGILLWVVAILVIGLILWRASTSEPDPGPCEGLDSERAAACFEQLQQNQEDRER